MEKLYTITVFSRLNTVAFMFFKWLEGDSIYSGAVLNTCTCHQNYSELAIDS